MSLTPHNKGEDHMNFAEMKKLADKAKAKIDMTPEFYQFKTKGDCVTGRLKSFSEVASGLTEGTYLQYMFETDAGLVKCALGKATDKEIGSLITIGRVYNIEFQGKEKISGGRSVNKFKIYEIDEGMLPKGSEKEKVPF